MGEDDEEEGESGVKGTVKMTLGEEGCGGGGMSAPRG